ncbi:hypothetical protein BGZ73_003707 [Actinomortierella ambigua]|nr:hypothetical protein BGZ73_003707 [Actinomortierella ambigua]
MNPGLATLYTEGLLVLVQAVLAKLPPPGNYRILSTVGNRPIRVRTQGIPLPVTNGTVSTAQIWRLKHYSGNLSTLEAKGKSKFANAGPGFVTIHTLATKFRLRPVGPNLFEIAKMNSDNTVWAVWAVHENKVVLRRPNNSANQKFRLVRV